MVRQKTGFHDFWSAREEQVVWPADEFWAQFGLNLG